MRFFGYSVLFYALLALLVSLLLRGEAVLVSLESVAPHETMHALLTYYAWVIAGLFALAWLNSPDTREFFDRVVHAIVAFGLCTLFIASFTAVKTALPLAAETLGVAAFYADPGLAAADRKLHFGIDPWKLAHTATAVLGRGEFLPDAQKIYLRLWALPAKDLPAILFLLGVQGEKLRHFLVLWFISWIVVGNVIALAGLSAGPIYYDRIFGGDEFAALHAALAREGIEGSWFGAVQENLWRDYLTTGQSFGSGISAFPSVHVATAAVTAIVISHYSRILGIVAWIYWALVAFVSVWIGYHYAVDAYASLAIVLCAHHFLMPERLRKEGRPIFFDAPSRLTRRTPGE